MDLSKIFSLDFEGSMLTIQVNIVLIALVVAIVFLWRLLHRAKQ